MRDELNSWLHHESLHLAALHKRVLAAFIDDLLVTLIFFVLLYNQMIQLQSYEEMIALSNYYLLEIIVTKIVYQTLFVHMYGATLGKIVVKIRVVTIGVNGNPTLWVALNRAIVRVVSELFLYLGYLWAFLTPERQGWHDLSAKTVVVDL